jgi:hypothetical protein
MGIEIIYPIAWLISIVALIWLIARSRNQEPRSYALPTLLISIAIALFLAWNDRSGDLYNKPDHISPFWQYFLTWFAPVALVLGLHAHLIRWLVVRRRSSGAP